MNPAAATVRYAMALAVCPAILAQAPHVTETKTVGAEDWKGQVVLRKINGRWWSPDNREVYPPGPGGVFWVLDSKPGVVQFFHHRPFQLNRAENLRLWMTRPEVEAILGQPNRIFGNDNHASWYYYAPDGVKLTVRFMDDGVLGEAKYCSVGEKCASVPAIESEMNGQDIYKLLQQRATRRLAESHPSPLRRPGLRAQPGVIQVDPVPIPRATETAASAPKRLVPADALATIVPGTTRDEVLSKLGDPSSRYAISDDEGTRESFTYDLSNGETVTLRLLNGAVVKAR